jgi:hypothetical protein
MVGHDAGPVSTTQRPASGQPRRRVDGRLVILLVVVALYSRGTLTGSLNPVALRTWTTVFVAIVVQALPLLVLGVLVSGAITALVSPAVLARPRRWRSCWPPPREPGRPGGEHGRLPGQPRMVLAVLARFLGSLLTSITVGLLWWRGGR